MTDKKALIVVDVQNDFLPGGALGIEGGDRIVPIINEYVRRFRQAGLPVIFTRDWHPAVTRHFSTQGGLWPPHCVQGTRGAEFSSDLDVPADAIVVSKGMDPNEDSYSAFDARTATGESLEALLRKLGVTHIYIAGLATDYCVRYSGRDALRRGIGITVLVDAVKGVSDEDSQRALAELAEAGASRATLSELPNLARPDGQGQRR